MDTYTLWVCTDCMMTEASGELPDEPTDREPWSATNDGDRITPGLMADEHDDGCDQIDADGSWIGDGDCFCEERTFSWSRCEGCGSTLGGSRHAYTLHLPTTVDA